MDTRYSIRAKLRKVIMVTTSVVLCITALSFIVNEVLSFRKAYLDTISTLADIVAENSTGSLAFLNETDARKALSTLTAEPNITRAALYNKSGELFAFYPGNTPKDSFPQSAPKDQQHYTSKRLNVVRPVIEETRLGTLYVEATLAPLFDRFQFYAIVVAGVLIVSLIIALALSAHLQKQISNPILALSTTAKAITRDRDYQVRASKTTEDEIGTLTDSFNDMLDQIETRDDALLQSGERLRLALEGSQAGTWDWDVVTNRLAWDEFAHRLFGLKPGEFNQTFEGFLERIHPEDRASVEVALRSALEQKKECILEARTIWPNGSLHYFSSRGKPFFDARGQPVRVTGMMIDVTETKRTEQALRESEERFRAMADAAPVMIWTCNAEGKTNYLNRAWLEFTGRTLQQEISEGWIDLVVPQDRPKVLAEWQKSFTARKRFEIEYRMRRGDGVERWLVDTGMPRFAPDGTFQGYIGSCIDVTDRKLAQAELEHRVQARTAELAETNRELESFTYSVSHDLRAPLRHMNAYAQIVREDFSDQLPAEGQSYLARIQEGAHNMGRLVDDLLNLARVGRQDLARENCDLNFMVQSIVDELKNDNPDRRIEWHISNLSPAECDAGLVRQVFMNLLANAVKYSRPREVAVIECGETVYQGERIIYVKDNGVGFSMKYASKLFGVFQRLHRAEDFEGTGVGLAIVERVVRKHGGRIWAEAELDKGAAFYFTLPVAQSLQGENRT